VLARFASAVPLLVGVSLVSFLLLHLAPGTFVDRLLLDPAIPQETVELLENRYGLDQPWYEQYLSWLLGVFNGDLGFSLAFQRPVGQLLGESALYTAALVVSGGALAFFVGLALSLLVALRPGGISDRALSGLAIVAASVPTLVVAVGALGLAASTGAFPLGGGSSAGLAAVGLAARFVDFVRHLLLPSLVLSLTLAPLFYLQFRGALMEVLPSAFAQAARSRGLSRTRVLFKHCLPAALVPVLTFTGSSVGRLLNGAFLVEVVMGWPGMGRLAWSALLARDSFLVLGVLLLAAVLMILGNLAADIAISASDPKIRLEES
jgi:peptide/nickel transport system permease protein